jgi:hypothetical protein
MKRKRLPTKAVVEWLRLAALPSERRSPAGQRVASDQVLKRIASQKPVAYPSMRTEAMK